MKKAQSIICRLFGCSSQPNPDFMAALEKIVLQLEALGASPTNPKPSKGA